MREREREIEREKLTLLPQEMPTKVMGFHLLDAFCSLYCIKGNTTRERGRRRHREGEKEGERERE